MNANHYHIPGESTRLRQELEATERQVEILSDELSKCSKARSHTQTALNAAKLLTANDEALMRLAIDAITNVLAGGDFDNPYADLKQAAAALKERLK